MNTNMIEILNQGTNMYEQNLNIITMIIDLTSSRRFTLFIYFVYLWTSFVCLDINDN